MAVNKVAFDLGGFPIYWYGVLIAVGFLVGLWTAARRAPEAGLTGEAVVDLGPWLVAGALVGARTMYVVSYWDEQFAHRPFVEVFMVRQGGMVFYGGFLGAVAVALLYLQVKGMPMWKVGDVLAPSIPLGQAFGRLGCLMNGCCYGRSCEWPWALHFPADHVAHGTGLHPTQIYEALLCVGLSVGLARWHRRKKFDGQIFAGYLLGYALLRSFVELFRGDYAERYLGGHLTPAQLLSAGILVVGIMLYWRLSPRPA